MSRLEDDLRSALRRRSAPAGFAARVLAQVETRPAVPAAPKRRIPRPAWALAAAAVLALGFGMVQHQRQQVEHRRQIALEETLTALRIAAFELDRAEQKALSADRWGQLGESLAAISEKLGQAAPGGNVDSKGTAPRI
jgi:hypothetical protein